MPMTATQARRKWAHMTVEQRERFLARVRGLVAKGFGMTVREMRKSKKHWDRLPHWLTRKQKKRRKRS